MRKTRLLSLLLAVLMIVGTLAIIPVTVSADGGWDGESKTQPAGEGTKEKPFLIANAENLAWLSYMTENYTELNELLGTSFASGEVFKGMYFVQTADIDLNAKTFQPIGFTQSSDAAKLNAFAGNYDGRSYTIANATIAPETQVKREAYNEFMSAGYHPGGIFGVLGMGAKISNINASNIKIGSLKTGSMLRNRIYTMTVAGVIAGSTAGNATIQNCSTDAQCVVYALYAAGGIIGLPDGGAYVSKCVNNATVSSCVSSGGIAGMGCNSDIAYCINRGKVQHYTTDRWSGAGGIMGMVSTAPQNSSCEISYCINEGEVSATCLQAGGSGSNRVAIGGMVGQDDHGYKANMKYSHCYNMQEHFKIKYLDNGNSATSHLALCGAVVGNTIASTTTVDRVFEHCYGVVADKTYDWTALSATSIAPGNGAPQAEKTLTFALDWNEQGPNGGAKNEYAFAGIVGSELTLKQITDGVGDPEVEFATCQYGVAADTLKAHPEYQKIVLLNAANEAYAKAPKYVGVQEKLDKSAGNYGLRFVLATTRTDYAEVGADVVVSYGDNRMQSIKLTADQYHNSLSGKVDGKGVNYTADSFGAEKLLALKLPVDLATYGAATYTVTPYFIEEAGGTPVYGREWEVHYAADGSFVSQNIVDIVSEEDEDNTSLYSIVYPADSVLAPIYTAIAVQNHILTKRGMILPLATERSTDPDAYEIVIVEDQTMETGAYKTEVDGNRLIVTAADTFGYIAAANRLVKQIFSNGRIKLNETYNTEGVYELEMIREKNGENRVIFQNVWCSTDHPENDQYLFSVTNFQYHLATVALYQPDVYAVNEFWYAWELNGFVEAMAAMGYERVSPIVNGQEVKLGNSIFYNTATTDYVANSSEYLSYGTYETSDVDGDGAREPVRRNIGEFAGRYFDNSDNTGKTAHAATFTDQTTGQSYTVCSTHLESNTYVDPKIAPLGNALRMEQVEKLIPFLKDYQEKYDAIILMGGDYNNADSYDYRTNGYSATGDTNPWYFDWADQRNNHPHGYATSLEDHEQNPQKALTTYPWYDGTTREYLWGACDELKANGFINTRYETTDTTYNVSTQGYPIRNELLNATVAFSGSTQNSRATDSYSGSIDHIYALERYEGELETLRYRNLANEVSLSTSDHKPVLIDFNLLTEDEVEPETPGDQPGSETQAWQGMDDFAAPTKGFGTKDNPYLIENAQHLAWLSRMVEDAAAASEFLGVNQEPRKVFSGFYFKQTADIDLNNLEFMPIGSYMGASGGERHLFAGQYDGNGFKIMNAKISMADHVGKDYYKNTVATSYAPPANPNEKGAVGHYDALFNVAASASIKNLTAVNVHTGNYDAEHTGSTAAGIICGFIIEASIINCTTDVTCSATAAHAAGLVVVSFGDNGSKVQNCTNNATITGTVKADGIWAHPLYTADKEENCTDNGTVVEGTA